MKYMGSKSRIAKYIVPILQKKINEKKILTYVEPFVGGANVIDKIKANEKIGCDKSKYLIALYENLDKIDTLPELISREHYSEVRECYNKKLGIFEDWYIGAIGFLASYNAKFFGGYAGITNTKEGVRNYYDEAKRNLKKQVKDLTSINWYCGDYRELCSNYKNCLIYCDPPYYGTTQYDVSKDFNYDEFWQWCREMSKENIVIISEHQAPEDFEVIWEAPVKRTMNNARHTDATEKLFVFSKSNYNDKD